jgi:DNA-binding NtrC family response regulator
MLNVFEKEYILRILDLHHWQKTRAAAALGISRKTLARKIKNFALS